MSNYVLLLLLLLLRITTSSIIRKAHVNPGRRRLWVYSVPSTHCPGSFAFVGIPSDQKYPAYCSNLRWIHVTIFNAALICEGNM